MTEHRLQFGILSLILASSVLGLLCIGHSTVSVAKAARVRIANDSTHLSDVFPCFPSLPWSIPARRVFAVMIDKPAHVSRSP
jgi:hypothetical protein